jgi:6-phosphogluconate dehydrogenase
MRTMGEKKAWGLDLGGIAGIWRGGCIIRARFLERITEVYRADPGLANLALAPYFRDVLNRSQQPWREVVALAVGAGIPVPAFSASLAYYDSLRTARGCRPTCCRRSATSSARTPTSASTGLPPAV